MKSSFNSGKMRSNPNLARILESGRSHFPSGVTTGGILSSRAQNVGAMIRDNREVEKRQIAELNNRLAKYIETVRFLEAQNRILDGDLKLFSTASNIHADKIHIYYEAEKKSLKTLIMETGTKIDAYNKDISKIEPDLKLIKRRMRDVSEERKQAREKRKNDMKKLCEVEAENCYMKRLINDSENEKAYILNKQEKIRSEIRKIEKLRDNVKGEIPKLRSRLQEKTNFLNGQMTKHEIIIREEISKSRPDLTNQNREYFHNELQSAMREIRDKLEKESRASRSAWEEWYKKKENEIKSNSQLYSQDQEKIREQTITIRQNLHVLRTKLSDAETLHQQLIKRIEEIRYREEEDLKIFESVLIEKENAVIAMRQECTTLSVQLDKLCDNNINLNNEIAYYRKLMERAETVRITPSRNVVIDTPSPATRLVSYHSYGGNHLNTETESRRIVSIEDNYGYSSHTNNIEQYLHDHASNSFNCESKCNIKILEHHPNGDTITIQNVNNIRSVDISNWKLEHYVRGKHIGTYYFPVATHIQPLERITIDSRHSTNLFTPYFAKDILSFDFSSESKTILINDADEEVAWYAHETYNH